MTYWSSYQTRGRSCFQCCATRAPSFTRALALMSRPEHLSSIKIPSLAHIIYSRALTRDPPIDPLQLSPLRVLYPQFRARPTAMFSIFIDRN